MAQIASLIAALVARRIVAAGADTLLPQSVPKSRFVAAEMMLR